MVDVNEASAVRSKMCAACGRRFPGDALYCPADGTPLQSEAAAERDASDPYLGQEISGHIEIRQTIGVGAMGRVYRAFQRGIDRDVAVKILHRELSANAQLVSRFTREAKVASRLQHPNVVQVLLAGQLPDGALYMVMEFLDGLSLQSALAAAGGAFSLQRALHMTLQLCEAVGEAHAQGIVHRDLKPENVMLVRRGSDPDFVKVLDFGIARIDWGQQSVATAAGLIFGTARYISPEGAQGNAVGPASDVYAIGTMLFQMLSGRTPFDGEQAVGLLVQQIHDRAPDLRSIPRAAYVPAPIADVVMATLVKDPTQREPDARALGQALFDAAKLSGLSPEEFSRPMMSRRPVPMRLAPIEATTKHELTPDVLARMTPSKNGVGNAAPTAATVKWEPPDEFQAKLSLASNRAKSSPDAEPPAGARRRTPSSIDETIDDLTFEAAHRQPSSPVFFPTPLPTVVRTQLEEPRRPGSGDDLPKTMAGDPDPPPRTQYAEPVHGAPPASVRRVSRVPEGRPSLPGAEHEHDEPRRLRGVHVFVLCFLLGVSLAALWAWKVGKLGGDADEESYVARATDAMFKNHFLEPTGENVKEITDEGLRRWPNDRKLLDVRVRAASELSSQAISHRAAGDILEALRLAKIAHELDPHDASARRLVEQYEGEVAAFSPSAAPTLTKPPDRPPPIPSAPLAPTAPKPSPSHAPTPLAPASSPASLRIDYKALLDVSTAAPRLGQTVALTARIAPNTGDFDAPGFTIAGPGVPGGIRMPAQNPSPGVFTASYAFLEPGRFEIVFSTDESGRPIAARRTVNAVEAPATPTTSPSGSVKWM